MNIEGTNRSLLVKEELQSRAYREESLFPARTDTICRIIQCMHRTLRSDEDSSLLIYLVPDTRAVIGVTSIKTAACLVLKKL